MKKLAILWTTPSIETAKKMILIYAKNAKKNNWWDEIQLIIWGESTKVVKETAELQAEIKEVITVGVDVVACKWCADGYEASELLEQIGVRVFYTGETLTEYLQTDVKVLSV